VLKLERSRTPEEFCNAAMRLKSLEGLKYLVVQKYNHYVGHKG